MKKRSAKKDTKIKRLFNKMGMTYVELICALALLSLIVVMFTPMLLSSYDTLYKAGEKVEEVYESKEEMEAELATRHSTSVINFGLKFVDSIGDNATVLFDNLNVKGRRIVSSYQQDFETAFGMIRPRIEIITPNLVYDDKSNHDITIQTMGLEYKKVSFGNAAVTENSLPNDQIHIKAILPNKSVANSDDSNISNNTQDETVYELNGYNATIQLYSADGKSFLSGNPTDALSNTVNKGQISFNLSGTADRSLDFTYSPVKIVIYYKNNRGKLMTVSDYLYIDPPTMILAGETDGTNDYFTSAGVEYIDLSTKDPVTGDKIEAGEYVLNVEGRKMRVDNSDLFSDADTLKSTKQIIKAVTWVGADENSKLKPYYVMAGTNGTVYRMYNYAGQKSAVKDVMGAQNDIGSTKDKTFILTDGSRVSPSFWSGEMSDQYYFRTEDKANGYGTYDDNNVDCSKETQYNALDKKFRYLMAFSGYRTGYKYRMQASRRISYILTEANAYSFRFGGKKATPEQYNGYTAVWEPSNEYYCNHGETAVQRASGAKWDVDPGWLSSRIIAGSLGSPYEKPIYFSNKDGLSSSENEHYETNLAYISAMSYTNINVFALPYDVSENSIFNRMFGVTSSGDKGGFFWANKGEDSQYEGNGGTIDNYLQTNYSTNVNIESAVYLPGSGSDGQGQVVYFGSVPAYTLLRQSSDIGKPDRYMYNGENIRNSRCTLFYIMDNNSNGTYIAKIASSNNNYMGGTSDIMKWQIWNIFNSAVSESSSYGVIKDIGSAENLFKQGNDSQTYFYYDPDLSFTFGYCSRWRMATGSVTSNGLAEETKSYEKFFVDSYYTDSNKANKYQRTPGINAGTKDNLYYNVWFPGEHYTLTHTATCDEITVACGYTVSGSTFMEESSVRDPNCSGFYGTALGSVYNDGVLAAYVSKDAGGIVYGENDNSLSGKGEQNTIFQNILYYKSDKFINSTLHSRKNIRFTAVDLFSVTPDANLDSGETQTVSKKYIAVYGDSWGRAFFSTIATSTASGKWVEVKDANGNVVKDKDGKIVKEWVGEESGVVLRSAETNNSLKYADMIEIKIGTESLSTYFSEITTIVAEEDVIIISGKPAEGKGEMIVVGELNDAGTAVDAHIVNNGEFTGHINDAMILGEFYYLVGGDDTNGGWLAAINVEELKKLSAQSTATDIKTIQTSELEDGKKTTDLSKLIWCTTGDATIYALDGRLTQS